MLVQSILPIEPIGPALRVVLVTNYALKVAIEMPDTSPQSRSNTKYWIIGGLIVLAIIVVLVAMSGGGGGTGGGY
ncbi:MAG TPA: hypothetical protein VKB55_06885 [Nocardioidaceae bacterium]|nr:hypothetical protein [Nocardioidaceae bacterium]